MTDDPALLPAARLLELYREGALSPVEATMAALKRIEDGTYDECETCGEPIGAKRLAVLPYATQCIRCAEESTG